MIGERGRISHFSVWQILPQIWQFCQIGESETVIGGLPCVFSDSCAGLPPGRPTKSRGVFNGSK